MKKSKQAEGLRYSLRVREWFELFQKFAYSLF